MRSLLGLGASALAALAAVAASDSRNADIVPFFIALTFAGGVLGWAVHDPFTGVRRQVARMITLSWAVAAAWVGVLLVLVLTVWEGSAVGPSPGLEPTFLGLPAAVFHLAGLYGGFVLNLMATFGPEAGSIVSGFGGRQSRGSRPAGTGPSPRRGPG